MNSITQDMKYRQSLMEFALRHGVSKASRKYNRTRSYIYFWQARYDGSIESLTWIVNTSSDSFYKEQVVLNSTGVL